MGKAVEQSNIPSPYSRVCVCVRAREKDIRYTGLFVDECDEIGKEFIYYFLLE